MCVQSYADLVHEQEFENAATLDLLVPHVLTMFQFLSSCLLTPEFCEDADCVIEALALICFSAERMRSNDQIWHEVSKPCFLERMFTASLSSYEASRAFWSYFTE
jgi:hypothetical protein